MSTTDKIADAVDIYRELARYPAQAGGSILSSSDDKFINITSEWSQRDLERSEKIKFATSHILSYDESSFKEIVSSPPQELNNEVWNVESPSGELRAILRKVAGKKGDEKQYIEIWCHNHKRKNIDVQALEKHGKVYDPDSVFGTFEWSKSEGHLLYIAERKLKKTASFFAKNSPTQEFGKITEEVAKGDEHVFREDWGEQLVAKHHPVICVLDIDVEEVSILDSVPEDISPGQAIWCPDKSGVVFVGYNHEPYRLGIIYCTQRRSAIYHIDLKNATCNVIGNSDQSVRSPKFSPDYSKLIWLENRVFGPHRQCSKLMSCNWETKSIEVLVDVVRRSNDDGFCGMSLINFSRRCWADDARRLVFSNKNKTFTEITVIDTSTKEITRIQGVNEASSLSLLDIHKDVILASCSSPTNPHYLLIGKLPTAGQEKEMKWHVIGSDPSEVKCMKWKVLTHNIPDERINKNYPLVTTYESILYMPSSASDNAKVPCAVYNHGGPHSSWGVDFLLYCTGLCQLGFAVLMVNYRGSDGYGEDFIESLPGHVGTQDVLDIQSAVEEVIRTEPIDKDRMVVVGGSHGGFLTAHLIGQYPEFYKAACLRNPVINVAAMVGSTDITDWNYVESGLPFDQSIIATKEAYAAMLAHSPIIYADKILTPSMLMIGGVDLRVPPKQGYEFYKALKSRGVPVRSLFYKDDSHPLNKVETEADAFVNIVHWFLKYL